MGIAVDIGKALGEHSGKASGKHGGCAGARC